MATATFIPVEEYLRTAFHPDVDYLEGEIQERNLGEQYHGLVQKMIASIFSQKRKAWGLRSLVEQRVQVRPTRFRIPDVCVVSSSDPIEPILRQPPLLCVEVLSPEDTFRKTQERVRDYLEMGVPEVWVIDPETREVWTCTTSHGLQAFTGTVLALAGTAARMSIAEIFEEIDEAPRKNS